MSSAQQGDHQGMRANFQCSEPDAPRLKTAEPGLPCLLAWEAHEQSTTCCAIKKTQKSIEENNRDWDVADVKLAKNTKLDCTELQANHLETNS